ncbi:MAG: MarR family transcriptional regulator [Actinomycetota bacterium]|nr:MarR family transcriptional regulator [Actinomycetota bacterium]
MITERQDLLASLLPVTKALRRIEDAAAAAHGVTMWQYAVLAVVTPRPGVNQAEVAALMDYSKNRIIADLDHLQQRGLLIREPGADRRSNVLRVTDDGVTVMRDVQAEIHRGEDMLMTGLSLTAVRDFQRISRRLGGLVRRRS